MVVIKPKPVACDRLRQVLADLREPEDIAAEQETEDEQDGEHAGDRQARQEQHQGHDDRNGPNRELDDQRSLP